MVRIKAPMLSSDAKGSLAHSITVRRSARGYTCTRTPSPIQPLTKAQKGHHAIFAALVQAWQSLTSDQKASWARAASPFSLPPFNSFMGHNLANWAHSLPPGKTYPIQRILDCANFNMAHPIGGVHIITLHPAAWYAGASWGYIFWRNTSPGVELIPANFIGILWAHGTGTMTYEDRGLKAGTYYYRVANFSDDGNIKIFSKERYATASDP